MHTKSIKHYLHTSFNKFFINSSSYEKYVK